MPARTRADLVPEGCFPASKPSMPLVRDGDEDNIFEVRRVERGTWDLFRVRELSEWLRDDAYTEVLVGRLFVTLEVKFAELAKSERKFRARAVY